MELSDTYWGAFTYRCDMHKRQIHDGDGLNAGPPVATDETQLLRATDST
jgi:hypothetical protein